MAAGRLLIVHDSAAARVWITDLLVREGHRVEAVDSSFDCLARHLEAPAELVLLGLAGLDPSELELVRTLKRDSHPPRILLAFPSPRRDLAVQALEAGADGYLLEPFYASELLSVVRAQLAPRASVESGTALPQLAREIAHAVGNPMQIITLLLQKEKVTKRDLTGGLPPHLKRIEQVVAFLREFGALGEAAPRSVDPTAIVEKCAKNAGVALDAAPLPPCNIDERALAAALKALLGALAARAGDAKSLRARLGPTDQGAQLEIFAPESAFGEEDPASLLDRIFDVSPEREAQPGLALPRALIEQQGGTLVARREGDRVVFVARFAGAKG